MLHRFAIAVAVLFSAGLASWVWYYPQAPFADEEHQRAQFLSEITWSLDEDWFGGFSGLELAPDGVGLTAVTDSGYLVTGNVLRSEETLRSIELDTATPLLNEEGVPVSAPWDDAEGLAISSDGRLFVSFEHMHRVWIYDTKNANARWASYTPSWRALSKNGGMEALAVDDEGKLWTMPERTGRRSKWHLIYTRDPNEKWQQPFVIRMGRNFRPVGADFGPDGRLYLLERAVSPFGFMSRVRVLTVQAEKVLRAETLLQSRLRRHGNLEGLAVWQDAAGRTRLTMISDDNFLSIMRTKIVEYVVR